jgi:D-alanyl-D-alanine dipeptidase
VRVIGKRTAISQEARAKYVADAALAAQFGDLLARAQSAEQEFREAQASAASLERLYDLGKRLDAALTDVMRAAFAAQRAEIGPRGYDDRIFRRKAMATSGVRAWTREAQRLLTLRETHRLTGIVRLPRSPAA